MSCVILSLGEKVMDIRTPKRVLLVDSFIFIFLKNILLKGVYKK